MCAWNAKVEEDWQQDIKGHKVEQPAQQLGTEQHQEDGCRKTLATARIAKSPKAPQSAMITHRKQAPGQDTPQLTAMESNHSPKQKAKPNPPIAKKTMVGSTMRTGTR